jgi:MtaA/CmuA family methyltransferase
VPYAKEPLLQNVSDLGRLKPVRPEDGRRMSQTIWAIEYYNKEAGNEFAVIGWVEGMFAEAADLRGVNNFLLDVCDEEEFVEDLCEILLENAIGYARAQVEAGADIIGVGDAISSVAGPNMYRRFAGKYQRRLLEAIRGMGAKTKLHICGDTLPFLDQIPKDVVDILDVDWMVPLDKAVQILDCCCLSGNYDPVAIVLQGTEEEIEKAVRGCAQIAGGRHMSAAGCEIPKDTAPENLFAIKRALESME